jgi:type II secretory ATPase GspE/PulE/Tfp pilus assembly ATPase PilB-like protein
MNHLTSTARDAKAQSCVDTSAETEATARFKAHTHEYHDIPNYIDVLFSDARIARASDIHIKPEKEHVSVCFRVDGRLIPHTVYPLRIHHEVISRIKVMAHLRTDEHYTAHDGRFSHITNGYSLDVRVAIAPTYYGENAVLRLLNTNIREESLSSLGFTPYNAKRVENILSRTSGMVLVTGPTGSGKTTTLYTLIANIRKTQDISLVTIEDPVEYAIPGVTQIPVHERTGLTFSRGLRTIVRQDPDVVMVGEIRDTETATVAVNTALTGHVLLSTLHTNDAITTLPRLLDMGIDAYLVASTVTCAIGQRLIRRLCPHCKQNVELGKHTKEFIDRVRTEMKHGAHAHAVPTSAFAARGCEQCKHTGYSGRIGIHEVLIMNDRLRDALLSHISEYGLREQAYDAGMIPLFEDGIAKVAEGITSFDEVLRLSHT